MHKRYLENANYRRWRQPGRIGGFGAILLWLVGIPIPIILLIYFLGGC